MVTSFSCVQCLQVRRRNPSRGAGAWSCDSSWGENLLRDFSGFSQAFPFHVYWEVSKTAEILRRNMIHFCLLSSFSLARIFLKAPRLRGEKCFFFRLKTERCNRGILCMCGLIVFVWIKKKKGKYDLWPLDYHMQILSITLNKCANFLSFKFRFTSQRVHSSEWNRSFNLIFFNMDHSVIALFCAFFPVKRNILNNMGSYPNKSVLFCKTEISMVWCEREKDRQRFTKVDDVENDKYIFR